jgi:hypothetical protein
VAKTSPTQRTKKFLVDAGFKVAITERWNQWAKVRQDLFGFIDLVAIHRDTSGVLGVQTTSGTNHAARRTKILESAEAHLWVECGNRIWLVSWAIRGAAGKRKKYEPRIESITVGMFSEAKEGAA